MDPYVAKSLAFNNLHERGLVGMLGTPDAPALATPAPPPGEIPSEMKLLLLSIDDAVVQFKQLCALLDPLLGPEFPTNPGNAACEPPLCALGRDIANARQYVQTLSGLISDVKQRVRL